MVGSWGPWVNVVMAGKRDENAWRRLSELIDTYAAIYGCQLVGCGGEVELVLYLPRVAGNGSQTGTVKEGNEAQW